MTRVQRTVRIGTRGSRLALVQADLAASAVSSLPDAPAVSIVEIRTRGDALSARRPAGTWVTGDGQFTSELERALLAGEIDVAVHSLKDLPTESRPDLRLAAILERGDPRDCLVSADGVALEDLPFGARIGTSSVRRAAQLAAVRPDLVAMPIRGNVETRLRRLAEGSLDALIVAAAGIDRLGIEVPGLRRLSFDVMLPAPGQAAIALQVRAADPDLVDGLAGADHAETRLAVTAERALLRAVGGGCLAPLGALATVDAGSIRLRAVYERDGEFARADLVGPAPALDALVAEAAAALTAPISASA